MNDFKNDHYYCEICGGKVLHKDAKAILGHVYCIDEIRKETRLFRFKKYIKNFIRKGSNK